MTGTAGQNSSPGVAPTNWIGDLAAPDYNSYADMAAFDAMNAMTAAGVGPNGLVSPSLMGAGTGPGTEAAWGVGSDGGFFQQPMLPQDLFSLPMTLDFEWAEMSGGAYPSVENGNFGSLDVNGGGGEGGARETAGAGGGGGTGESTTVSGQGR